MTPNFSKKVFNFKPFGNILFKHKKQIPLPNHTGSQFWSFLRFALLESRSTPKKNRPVNDCFYGSCKKSLDLGRFFSCLSIQD